jgi:formylglycine-generating enzyme required for sulfatase activity
MSRAALALGAMFAGPLAASFATRVTAEDLPPVPLENCATYSGLPGEGDTEGMAFISAGTFSMGSDRHRPEERFTHIVRVDGFWIDHHEVTNTQFAKFVAATRYVTLAERGGDPKIHVNMPNELLAPGSIAFIMPTDVKRGGSITRWFQYIPNASWRHPEGPDSSIGGRENHPVVHVAYEDALAYARWRGRSLPTEAQWEYAARGGRDGEDDWSSAFDPVSAPGHDDPLFRSMATHRSD